MWFSSRRGVKTVVPLMTESQTKSKKHREPGFRGLTRLSVRGYKSLSREQSIEIRPLTILAGANSSGKSSVMQPLLLMKQTLEASFDPGALLLNGPILRFTGADQLLSKSFKGVSDRSFSVRLESGGETRLESEFAHEPRSGFKVSRTLYGAGTRELVLKEGMSENDIERQIEPYQIHGFTYKTKRDRCLLRLAMAGGENGGNPFVDVVLLDSRLVRLWHGTSDIEQSIRQTIHLPGLRGNPLRGYPVSAVGSSFPGSFEPYVASVIAHWESSDREKLESLGVSLHRLGLTWKIEARRINETQVELRVGRLLKSSRGGARDLVNIADVGFGVSQSLPVLVALLAARPGQLVYLEQPEIHLHPRAQTALAEFCVEAAGRGARVVLETHSELLILGIQTLVAEGKFPAKDVKLHWFTRSDSGVTTITSADLDDQGTFGDWPEDFADVALNAQNRFLNAAELKVGAR
jgi:hypothetical protein